MKQTSPTEMGQELIRLIRTKRDGASANVDLAARCIALIEAGADLAARDEAGMTPLMHAAANYRRRIFDALMQRQPEPLAVDHNHLNAFDHAKLKKQRPAMQALLPVMQAQLRHGFHDVALKKALRPAKPVRFRPKA